MIKKFWLKNNFFFIRYIKNRKEIQVQKAKIEELDPNCPNGHVPLPDCERKETLQMLKKSM